MSEKYKSAESKRSPMPDLVIIAVTTNCNSRCSYCDVWSQCVIHSQSETVAVSIKAAGRLGVTLIALTGGEPFLNEDIVPLVALAKSKTPLVTLSTNGTLLSRSHIASLEDAGLDALIVSLDTLNPDTYMTLRGMSIEHVLHGLENALSEARSIRLAISCVLSRANQADLPDLAHFCIENKLLLGFTLLHDLNGLVHPWQNSGNNSTLSDMRQIIAHIRSLEGQGLVLANSSSYIDALEKFLVTGQLPFRDECPDADRSISISYDGSLQICPYMPPIGNVQETDIVELLNSDRRNVVRDRMHRLDCHGCWHSYRADRFDKVWIEKLLNENSRYR